MREGYRWLPKKLQMERDEQIVRLFDLGVYCRGISEVVGLTYEGTRRILRKAGRMGKNGRVKIK